MGGGRGRGKRWETQASDADPALCPPHLPSRPRPRPPRNPRSPEEYPFTDAAELPPPILKPFPHPPILHPNKINVNASILSFYTQSIVPRITRPATLALAAVKRAHGISGDDEYEDDGNYGSAAFVDLEVLQAISKRVHYGVYRISCSPLVHVSRAASACAHATYDIRPTTDSRLPTDTS